MNRPFDITDEEVRELCDELSEANQEDFVNLTGLLANENVKISEQVVATILLAILDTEEMKFHLWADEFTNPKKTALVLSYSPRTKEILRNMLGIMERYYPSDLHNWSMPFFGCYISVGTYIAQQDDELLIQRLIRHIQDIYSYEDSYDETFIGHLTDLYILNNTLKTNPAFYPKFLIMQAELNNLDPTLPSDWLAEILSSPLSLGWHQYPELTIITKYITA